MEQGHPNPGLDTPAVRTLTSQPFVTTVLFGCSEFAALLAAVHLSVFVRDLQWSAESSYVLRPLHLAGTDQRRPQPLDLLHDADVSTTRQLSCWGTRTDKAFSSTLAQKVEAS